MSAKARTRSHRRDRRKAKQSRWTRDGKTNMGRRIGHGNIGSGGPASMHLQAHALDERLEASGEGLKVKLEELTRKR